MNPLRYCDHTITHPNKKLIYEDINVYRSQNLHLKDTS